MSAPQLYTPGTRHGRLLVLTRWLEHGFACAKFRCDCGRTFELEIRRLREYRGEAIDLGIELACPRCVKAARPKRVRRHVSRNEAERASEPRFSAKFKCQSCCDLPHRDCWDCGRAGVPEALPKATGWERTDEVAGRFR